METWEPSKSAALHSERSQKFRCRFFLSILPVRWTRTRLGRYVRGLLASLPRGAREDSPQKICKSISGER